MALGDSYTVGTSVRPAESWPDQLVQRLAGRARLDVSPSASPFARTSSRLALVANLGVNGATSGEVIGGQLPRLARLRPEFVSLLVGVNDVVQGVAEATYRANASYLLDELLGGLPRGRILTVGTPDYTVTPRGAHFGDPRARRAALRRSNAILAELAAARAIRFVDVFDISEAAATDPTLVAGDGLHPSGAQYARWVDRIAPVVAELLNRP